MEYRDFIESKSARHHASGFDSSGFDRSPMMFDFQRDIVSWATMRGKAAIFADTGLGKTLMQMTFADHVHKHTSGNVIVVTPLCVANQTVREALKFGIESSYVRDKTDQKGIHVTNYEMLKHFNPDDYHGIVIDESSILKGMDGKTRRFITDFAKSIPYRLSCTATPSPNDFMELGTQSEFLSIMSQAEMLAMFFIHDGNDTSKWRLKGHARKKFWEWLSTWAIVIRNPSDLGYDGAMYDLPELIYHEHIVETSPTDGLFVDVAMGLLDRNRARRDSVDARVEKSAEIALSIDGQCLIWCNLNDESEALKNSIDGAVEVKGSDSVEHKEKSIIGFTDGDILRLITKPNIAGFGVNWQGCSNMIFTGISDSFEAIYQAVRRCWRFGQTRPVHVHIVVSDREGGVLENIKRKERNHKEMQKEMADIMSEIAIRDIRGAVANKTDYMPAKKMIKPKFGV